MILLSNSFETKTNGHGGNQRSAQISELLQDLGYDVESSLGRHKTTKDVALSTLKLILSLRLNEWYTVRKKIRSLVATAARLQNMKNISAIVSERFYWFPEQYLASTTLKKTFAVPQNIESLVPNQPRLLAKTDSRDFAQEMQLISRSLHCFCICREDSDIVASAGIKCSTLPYYPTRNRVRHLLEIRSNRQNSPKNFILILGSALNSPTRMGIQAVLEYLTLNYCDKLREQIVVAGHHTEIFKEYENQNISVRGTISDEELTALQLGATCLLINQAETTGSLTRITEALIAGIPVISNPYGARGNRDKDGVKVCSSVAELVESAVVPRNIPTPSIPAKPTDDENYFKAVISSAIPSGVTITAP